MSCFTQNAGYVTYKLKLYNQIRSPNMQKKVMFLWKQNRWYHSIIYSLINRIWVYPKNAILIFQTMILLVKQVLVHVYGVHKIKCKVFYIYYWCIMKRFAMQMLFEINHSHVLFLILQMLCKSFMALEIAIIYRYIGGLSKAV